MKEKGQRGSNKMTRRVGETTFKERCVKGNVVRTNVNHKYIKDLKLNITIDLDGFIYYPTSWLLLFLISTRFCVNVKVNSLSLILPCRLELLSIF